jgi:hypothetical protein
VSAGLPASSQSDLTIYLMSNVPDYTNISHCLLDQVKLCNRIISGYLEYEVAGLKAE